MTIGTPPEWVLYNTDLTTIIGTIKPINPQIYLKLNDSGAGQMTLPKTDTYYGSVAPGQFIGLTYRGAFRTGFFVDNLEYIEASSKEYAGLVVNISGRGMMSILDDAVVWDWWTPGTDDIRYFGVKNPLSDGSAAVPKGEIIYKLLDEAHNYQTNDAGNHLERYCWRVGGGSAGAHLMDWDFSATADSNGTPWSDTENMEFRIGVSLLDVAQQIAALQYDFDMDFDAAGAGTPLVLHAYNNRIGTDRSGSVVFQVGVNCMNVSRKIYGGEIKNAILLQFSHDWNPFSSTIGTPSMTAYRRRESLLQCANATDGTTALVFGTAELAVVQNPKYDITIGATDAVAPAVFTDYTLGDTIGYQDISGGTLTYRVTGLQLTWPGENPYANVMVEFTST